MAAPVMDVFLNQNMVAFLDKDRTVPYQPTDGCIGEEGPGLATNLHPADCTCPDTCNVQPTTPLQRVNEGFTKEQTLFLIDLMKVHLEAECGGPAKSLDDLNRRLRLGKKTKKQLWEEMAGKLGGHFGEDFQTDKVARKWLTLVERYEKVKQKNVLKEKRPFRFQFYTLMDELLGGDRDDVEPPPVVVVSDCVGAATGRPGATLTQSNGAASPAASSDRAACSAAPPPGRVPARPSSDTPRSHKRQRTNDLRDMTEEEDDLLAYLERSDAAAMAASQRRHEESLTEMRALRADQRELLQLFSRMVDKM